MARKPGVAWTPRLIAVVAELTERGLSAPAISVVLDLYEGTTATYKQVKWAQAKAGVRKSTLRKTHRQSTNEIEKKERINPATPARPEAKSNDFTKSIQHTTNAISGVK